MHLVSDPLGLRQTTDSRCSDKPAPHHYPPSATSTNPTRACLYSEPCPGHLLGSLQALEGPNAPASSARQSLVDLQGQLWGPHPLSLGVWGWAASQLISWWSDKRAYAYSSSGFFFFFFFWEGEIFIKHHVVACQVGLDFSRVQLALLGVPSLRGF